MSERAIEDLGVGATAGLLQANTGHWEMPPDFYLDNAEQQRAWDLVRRQLEDSMPDWAAENATLAIRNAVMFEINRVAAYIALGLTSDSQPEPDADPTP